MSAISATAFSASACRTYRSSIAKLDSEKYRFGQMARDECQVRDLLSDARYVWRGGQNYVERDPEIQPAHIFSVRR